MPLVPIAVLMDTAVIGVSDLHRAEVCLATSAYNVANQIPKGV